MRTQKILWTFLLPIVLISLACSALGSQTAPETREPAGDVYATAIATGGTHACALLNDGRVKCWGANHYGGLGDGTRTAHNTPIEVPGLTDVVAISAGSGFTCAVLASGEAMCWGQNENGELGDGTKDRKLEQVRVLGLGDAASISAGFEHTCAVTRQGGALCWGKNLYGRIGNDSYTRIITSPAQVLGMQSDVTAISAGMEHTCALTRRGKVHCWGSNGFGQVGDNTRANRKAPSGAVGLDEAVTSISTGYALSCAVTKSNQAWCWGMENQGDDSLAPWQMKGLAEDIAAITVNANHICGLTTAGTVECLGENKHGQLGNGSYSPATRAKTVDGLRGIRSVAAGLDYTCALAGDGRVFCWGWNEFGQLGNGANTDSPEPVEVTGLIE